jgi:5-aminopentanamidase
VRVAAYQAPLPAIGSLDVVQRIRVQVERCEAEGVAVLCCPEAVLGGLADTLDDPFRFAITADRLSGVLAPLASDIVTTIVGFTEQGDGGRLYNTAAVFERGSIVGLYRKRHPAINRSVYHAGSDTPVFRAGALTFGIAICNDSNFAEPALAIAAQGAAALLVPTNNALPEAKGGAGLVERARTIDMARAMEHRLWVIRADVAGRCGALTSYGSSAIVSPAGDVVCRAARLGEDLLIAEIDSAFPR